MNLNSQTVLSVYWAVVNRATGARVRVMTMTNAIGSQGLLPFWKFSPCGDTIGLALPAGNQTNILLFATKGGAILNPGELVTTTAALTIKTDGIIHFVDLGTLPVTTLADNTAGVSCSGGGGGGTTPRPSGIECGCSAVGSYKNPAAPAPLTLKPQDSPHGKYRVVWEYGSNGQITSLSVSRISAEQPQTIVSFGALPGSTFWGFSSDDDRFALYSIRQTITGS